MPRRNANGGLDLSPQDEKLLQLQQLQGAGQQQDEASNNETAGLVKMLSELYGLHEHQQIDPALLEKTQAETGLAKAHTQYYEEKPEELKSRALAAELGGLDKAYAYDSNSPEYHQARRNVLSKYGYNLDAPAAAKPQGELTSGTPAGTSPQQTPAIGRLMHLITPQDIPQQYNWLHNEVGVPLWNKLAPSSMAATPNGGVEHSPLDRLKYLYGTNPLPTQPKPVTQ